MRNIAPLSALVLLVVVGALWIRQWNRRFRPELRGQADERDAHQRTDDPSTRRDGPDGGGGGSR